MKKILAYFDAPSQHREGSSVRDALTLYAGDTYDERYVGLHSVCNALGLDFVHHRDRAKSIEPVNRGFKIVEDGDLKIAAVRLDMFQVWVCSIRPISIDLRWREKLYRYQIALADELRAIFDSYHKGKAIYREPRHYPEADSPADKRFSDLPVVALPKKDIRSALSQLVRSYARDHGNLAYNFVWRKLYREVNYTLHIDLLARSKNSGKSALDIAEDLGIMEQVWGIAYRHLS